MLDLSFVKEYFFLILAFCFFILSPGYVLIQIFLPCRKLNVILKSLHNSNFFIVRRYFYFLFSPAIGLVLFDGIIFILNKINLKLSFNVLFFTFFLLNILLWSYKIAFLKNGKKNKENPINKKHIFVYSFIALWIIAISLRTIFYLPDVVPQNTDLGHHMYWVEVMNQNEAIPNYESSEVIVGEHLIFGAIAKITGISLLSAFPLIILSFYNLLLILALFFVSIAVTNSKRIALFTFFLSGIYFAIDSPQAKFIKGGVIGNTFGNYFIALCFLLIALFFRYFIKTYKISEPIRQKSVYFLLSTLISIVLFLLGGLLYTHHLSAFLLIFCVFFSFLFWITFNISLFLPSNTLLKSIWKSVLWIKNVVIKPKLIIIMIGIICFLVFIYTPFYLQDQAINTVVRAPLKETHLGYPFAGVPSKIGYSRLFFFLLAFIGIAFYVFNKILKKNNFLIPSIKKDGALLLALIVVIVGWFTPLFILTFTPQIFRIDLPSQRIINYLLFPVIILASFGTEIIYVVLKQHLKKKVLAAVFVVIVAFTFFDGTTDFRTYFTWNNKFSDTVQLYEASKYLNKNSSSQDLILKDHISLVGDSWIKFFLLRGYDYIISRTYDYKYEVYDPYNEIDKCPRDIIDVPESYLANMCYGQKEINYVILRPKGEEFFFWRAKDYSAIYASDVVYVFKKKPSQI